MKRTGSNKVSFNDISTNTVLVDTETTASQRNACWYTPEELRKLDDDEDTVVDEEALRKQNERSKIRREFVRSILERQTEHKTLGIDDPKGLRMLSRACSKYSRALAENSAQLNQSESLSCLLNLEAQGNEKAPASTLPRSSSAPSRLRFQRRKQSSAAIIDAIDLILS
jgi:hypothetical protein